MTSFAAVVPVLDEVDAIGGVVRGLRRAGACCVIVVDGGSRDGTREIACAAGAVVIIEPRRGYGRAVLTGSSAAVTAGATGHVHERIAFLDGDGSCDPADVVAAVDALDRSDLALGWRPRDRVEAGALPVQARLGNLLVTGLLRLRTGRRVRDLAPTKAVRRDALVHLELDATGYAWPVQLVARALAEPRLRIAHVPVGFRVRRGGVSKVSGSWRAALAAGRQMIAMAMSETRTRPVIALMAKAPRGGHAKTRLSRGLGERPTAAFWTASLADTAANSLTAARAVDAVPIVMAPGLVDVDPLHEIVGPHWAIRVQRGRGLAGALADVFLDAHANGADRALAVAGDIPHHPPAELIAAFHALDAHPGSAVLGPSLDGGYHYVGLRWRPAPRWWPRALRARSRRMLTRRLEAVFAASTGGSDVLAQTVAALRGAGWQPVVREARLDVDTLDDLRTLDALIAGDGHWAPRTSSWLASHRHVIGSWSDDAPLSATEESRR